MPATDRLAQLGLEAQGCLRCPLSAERTHVVFGVGDPGADLMLVGEAPGRDEDLQGEPFVGRSGQLLDRLIGEALGIDRTSCYITNVVKCRPPGNRNPRRPETAACHAYLAAQIDLVRPVVVVTLGNIASRLLLETDRGITELRGSVYPFGTATLVPTFHPAAAMRSGARVVDAMRSDLVRAGGILGWAA